MDVRGWATMNDSGCGPAPCTTVDTTLFGMPIDLADGSGVIKVQRLDGTVR